MTSVACGNVTGVPTPEQETADDTRRARFETLAADVVEPLRRYLARRTDPDTADDVLADTLLVCWRRLEDVPEPALPWVYGVARKCLDNAVRGQRRRERLAAKVAAVDPPGTDPGSDAVTDPRAEEVRSALARLRPAEAELLRLWAWEELGPAEIAVALELSPNAVSVRLHRARGKLRHELGKTGRGAGHEESRGGSSR